MTITFWIIHQVKATPYFCKKRRVICKKRKRNVTEQPVFCKLISILSTFLSSQRVCCRLYYTMTSTIIKWRGLPCTHWYRAVTGADFAISNESHTVPLLSVTIRETLLDRITSLYVYITQNKTKKSCAARPLFQMTFIHFKLVLGAFTNSKKRLLASSCQSVRPEGTTRLPLDGFWWNLVKISPITGPRYQEGSRKLRFPDYVTMAQDGGKVVSLTHRPLCNPRKYSWFSFLLEVE